VFRRLAAAPAHAPPYSGLGRDRQDLEPPEALRAVKEAAGALRGARARQEEAAAGEGGEVEGEEWRGEEARLVEALEAAERLGKQAAREVVYRAKPERSRLFLGQNQNDLT
jgi:hypothetical protein